jgi:tripartite ATP-independent transporter DctP family solute receptor
MMTTIKSKIAGGVAAAIMAVTFAGGSALAQQAPIVLKLAHGATTDQAIGKGMLKFAELVAQKSGGKVKVETYLAGSLYSERTALEAMVNGSVDFAGASNANWAAFTNALLFMDLPYVFNDEASFRKALDGKAGQAIAQRFEKAGFKLLMRLDNGGFRDIVNNRREVRVPADVKGLKFRTTASPVEIAMFRNWGGIATAIDWAEVYNALGSGVVDGEFVMSTWLSTAKHYEVLKYSTENKAVIGIQTLAIRSERFEKLSPDVQKVILEAAKEAEVYANKLDQEGVEAARAHAKKLGVKTYQPTEAEMKIWRETGRQIWKQFEKNVDKELLDLVLESQKTN